ncbi:MAG: archaeal proteasome endopeptidase complex subunit alpha [Candidatus Nezhaarchaeota archaeon]|nr:archaeal proteasome endopeptidase complex subunit alpha [Candidatus Nezhaarchaeota archaeon]MCX8141927.1 archaeal proteasome endopeptidase complex subunit alpha [Candidatus Nezhaarchaeota archaeon]MDW8050292.1 archaeal proteasome endopeptidase complex subunit alpha [Nitrososphaerota archaeon]
MFTPPSMGYDRAITVFSPEGRLYQVEYALEAVKRGWTTLGIKCQDGVVVAVEKKRISPLVDPDTMEKIWKIDDHVGIAYAGLASDGRVLIDRARIEAQIHRMIYDEPIDIEVLTRRISDLKQLYTQHAGVRPFGVSFIIAGVDRAGPRLYMTEPSGAYAGYHAVVIGVGAQIATELLEKHYELGLNVEKGIFLALKCMEAVIEGGLQADKIEIAIAEVKRGRFDKLRPEDVRRLIEKYKGGKESG